MHASNNNKRLITVTIKPVTSQYAIHISITISTKHRGGKARDKLISNVLLISATFSIDHLVRDNAMYANIQLFATFMTIYRPRSLTHNEYRAKFSMTHNYKIERYYLYFKFYIAMDKLEADRINHEIVRRDELRKSYDAHIKGLSGAVHPMRLDDLRRVQINILSVFDAMESLDYPGHTAYMKKLRQLHADTLMRILAAQGNIAHEDAKYKSQRVDQWIDNQASAGYHGASSSHEEPLLELNVSAIDLEILVDEPTANAMAAPPTTNSRTTTVRSEVHKIDNGTRGNQSSVTPESQRQAKRDRQSREPTRACRSTRRRRHTTTPSTTRLASKIIVPPNQSQIAFDWNKLRTKFTIPKLTSPSVSPPKERAMGTGDLPERRSVPIIRKPGLNMAANPFRRGQTTHTITSVQRYNPVKHDRGTMPVSIPLMAIPDATVTQLQQTASLAADSTTAPKSLTAMADQGAVSTAQGSNAIFQRLGPRISDPNVHDAPPLEATMAAIGINLPLSGPLENGMGIWPDFVWPPIPKRTIRQAKRHRSSETRPSPVCLCCIMFGIPLPHTLAECPHFILFTVDQRKELIERWHICSDCWQYGHKKCEAGRRCNVAECITPHSELLCPANDFAIVEANRVAYKPPNLECKALSTQPPYCLGCVMFKQLHEHPIWECEHFLGLEVPERNELINKWGLCCTCGRYGQFGCNNKVLCTKQAFCGEVHHPILCEFEKTADIEENMRRAIKARQNRARQNCPTRRSQ